MRTFQFATRRSLLHLLRRAQPEQQVRKREACWIINAFSFGTTFAQVNLLSFPFDHLREMNCGNVLFANVAKHIYLLVYRLLPDLSQGEPRDSPTPALPRARP